MICLTKNERGAELLTGYLARTLNAAGMADVDGHIQDCAECRGLVSVWEKLDVAQRGKVAAAIEGIPSRDALLSAAEEFAGSKELFLSVGGK